MSIRRRQMLLAGPVLLSLQACSTLRQAAPEPPAQPVQQVSSGPPDEVAVYLVPLGEFPQGLALNLAKGLQQTLGIRIESTVPLTPLRLSPQPGTNQYESEALLVAGRVASASFAGISEASYCVFLTVRPINSAAAASRYQVSAHNRGLNSSVVSLAGLLEPGQDRPIFTERTAWRLFKMSKRAIGEMHLGWSRSTEPLDLMYAPILSLEDVDRIGYEHTAQPGAH
ncbi:MAG: hypothetical protein H0W48_09260 [Methylibium sp.]|uniref:hypothetical protein n=1 Tax=Methylibium sp. TaxID=2067992 RepID=UPI0017CD13B6|nr:hypothetical protein [Methylibium sp.]MBA2722874.1 hypothetical protein [Methylibium sp.]MBA3590502.1 hypothetical protein [Methylibium sp.]MBA3624620.1 hypothetical protein [Methylibium sp.]